MFFVVMWGNNVLKGENAINLDTMSAHQLHSNKDGLMMEHGGRPPDTYQYAYPPLYTLHADLLLTCPSFRLCARLLFSSFVSESEETSLSVSAFSLLCVYRHTHIQYVHRHTNTCTHRHAHTLPSAAMMALSCQNILAFSPYLSPKQPG